MGFYFLMMWMGMSWECFCFVFILVHRLAQLCLQWPLAQLFPSIWEGIA
jgi:hypothetical protein